MLPQNGTKRNVSSPHLPVMLPICQGDSHSPFLALVTVNARARWWWWGGGGVRAQGRQKQDCSGFLNGYNSSWGSLSFFLERSEKT